MVGKARTVNRDLFVRRCLDCGYDGALLQGGAADRCALCGCDLRRRPARSYAEMEGIGASGLALDRLVPERASHPGLQRWLTFLFFVVGGLALVAYLLAQAVP